MKFLISYLVFSSPFLSYSPAMASNYIGQAEYEVQREYQGWLDVVCTYCIDGLIVKDYVHDVPRRVNLSFIAQIVLLGDQAPQQDNWLDDKKIDRRYGSSSDSIWPRILI